MKQPSVKSIVLLIVVLTLFFLLLARGHLDSRERVRAAPLAPLALNVNDTNDLVDDNPGNGICHTVSGTCTLRAAIVEANALTTTTTINLPAGIYTLTITGTNEYFAATGDLDIYNNMSIVGALSTTTVIKGAPGWDDRIFYVLSGNVQISGVTIRNGNPTGGGGGGGIKNAGNLTLVNSALISNTTYNAYGGGLYNTTGATATLTSSIIISNSVSVPSFLLGGGIYNDGVLTLDSSTLISNTAYDGGALYSFLHGKVTLKNSSILSNSANFDSGLTNQGPMTITNSSISYNQSANALNNGSGGVMLLTASNIANNVSTGSGGAGISNSGILTMTNSTVVGNVVQSNAGGGIVNAGIFAIVNSAIINNSAGNSAGGIENGGTLTMTNSTISGNTANAHGGGLHNAGGTAFLGNVTIANNTADNDNNGSGEGGGISIGNNTTITLANSLIANNIAKSGAGPDCYVDSGSTLNSLGYNLVQTTTNCAITGTLTGIITGTNPLLGPLRNNGGTTFTHALLAGSPAIDAGNPTGCRDWNSVLLTTDQRGFHRPVSPRCDIGAYEYQFLQLFLPFITRP